jgi:hypothetical protein
VLLLTVALKAPGMTLDPCDNLFTCNHVRCLRCCSCRCLHYAALHGHGEVAEYLLQKARDRNLASRCDRQFKVDSNSFQTIPTFLMHVYLQS